MAWNEGYVSDIEYTNGFYSDLSPHHLNFSCILNGIEPVPLDQPYTYFELGFGRGQTLNILAAANANGQFYGNDFNPAHVAGARALAASAQLNNLTLLEYSFEELAQGRVSGLPQFDFIALHGIYTWVSRENRQHIVDFIARYLKPGGIVSLSYNAMPGWSCALPLQRLLLEFAASFPGRSDLQMQAGIAYVQQLQSLQAGYIADNPALAPRLNALVNSDPHYSVHEYLNQDWEPLYHTDVMRDVAGAKLDFAGSSDLPFAFPELYLNADQQATIDLLPDAAMREMMKDYFLNTSFRKDVLVRGARRMGTVRQAECLADVHLAMLVPRAKMAFTFQTKAGVVTGNEQVYGAVCDALAIRPHSLAELAALPALPGQSVQSLAEVAAMLVTGSQVVMYFPDAAQCESDGAAAHRLNQSIVAQLRYGDDYRVLCSPLTGSGIDTEFIDRLLFSLLIPEREQPDLATLRAQAASGMAQYGRRLLKEGAACADEAAHRQLLNAAIDEFMRDKLPVLQQLRML
ncbi:methyltransferase [Janthinobacterium sp. BJB1]|nr:methyltransferase [Janthinobacterium sp. BJB1]